jgi:hypothetical protein
VKKKANQVQCRAGVKNAELRALRWHLIAVSKDGNLPYQRQ